MSQPAPSSPTPERPGRYQRSFGGLVGSMIVLVVAVVVIWVALGLFRDEAEFEPVPIDYAGTVEALVDNGVTFTYPQTVPAGWTVNNLSYDPADEAFSLALLTDEERFAGVWSGYEDVEDVLGRLVDEATVAGEPVELAGETWEVFTDDGGDTAYVREVGSGRAPLVVMVYGSAPEADLELLVDSLVSAG